jgi:mutator protein MutT
MASAPTPIAVAVVEHEGRLLIGKRPDGVALAGLWEFPGGKVEPGETPAAAAQRECLEETGIAVRVDGAYPQHTQSYEHDCVQLHFVACTPLDPSQTPRPPYRWVPRSGLSQYEFPAGNRALLEYLSRTESRPSGPLD